MSDTTTTTRRPTRWRTGAAVAAAATAALVLIPALPAAAHHGWDGFETDNLVYISGTVSSDGSWGEPHSYFDVALDSDLPVDTPELTIPEELQDPEDSTRVEAALSYAGPHDELEVIIAPPAWSGRWGLDRPLAIDESFHAVGYINRTDDDMFRPVVFWYGDDDVPVNQVLGNTLPVRAPLPGDAAATPAPATTSTAQDPLEMPTASEPSAEDSSSEADAGSWGVWTLFGVIVVGAAIVGVVYLRRRNRQN